ncbi:helix-turn-helix transcriptional regulator [Savagea sp. SN6]|uniref:Helix-turn-helix transcriptional regulator n=1 Tax=Savagea serpentis TaxID=2785297 RepID=A0A8J7GE22_9BACL|nr:winged helix-turn-helix domain-containing protein [Savagea serpentis]MBF4501921.1 helix-turn-helix transcriptional regulator [Savagea serpentis]
MKDIFYIENIDDLKVISDPFRIEILVSLGTIPQSGQELAEKMNVSRSKVHYHLKELEKHGFIEVVKQNIVNGIVQKFYLPVAKVFVPDINIFSDVFFNEFKEILIKKEKISSFKKDIYDVIEKYSEKEEKKNTKKVNIYIKEF